MSKQQTAVEWLQQLYNSRPAYEEFILPEEFELAKEMEKRHIEEAFDEGNPHEFILKNGQQYYNETFKTESD